MKSNIKKIRNNFEDIVEAIDATLINEKRSLQN